MSVINYLWFAIFLLCSLGDCQEYWRFINRLPNNVQPHSYDLTLWMPRVWNNFTYNGQIIINISIVEITNSIILNIDGLIIHNDNTTLINNKNESMIILSQLFDMEKQFFIINFNENLKIGNYSLYLLFNGEIRDDLFGFYRSLYNINDKTKWISLTQFSPIFARRAFPCFDEPYLKATFILRIGHYGNQTVTSNTQRLNTELTDTWNYYLTTMKKTPIMSTYLFGWAIHDFNYYHLPNLTSFGLWSRQSINEKRYVALEEGKLIYSALESWVNIKNPIGKLEHVAVPDFNFNAMENWGMITFRESSIIFDTDITPIKSIHNGLGTIAHEYAHTWFGNLVTPEYWDVAWLKEGFATYFSYFSRSLVYPQLNIMDLFVVEILQDVFQDDSTGHNRTMNGKYSGVADDILSFLDFSAYKKGAAIVRMIQNIMGEESFKMALRSYLLSRSYNFSTPSILYTYLQNYTKISSELNVYVDIEKIIESYANQAGYPLVTITRNYSSNVINISQEQFNINLTDDTKYLGWWIPLNLATKSKKKSNVIDFGSIWLSPDNKKISLNINIDPTDWVICDINKAGYYRINYDVINWNILIEYLNTREFNGINHIARATLVDDAFNLARSGYIHYKIPFKLTNYLQNETKYEPWFAAMKCLNFLNYILQDVPVIRNSLQEHIKRIIEPIYQSLTFHEIDGDKFHTKLLRNLILTIACEIKISDCLNRTTNIYENWIINSSYSIPPNLKSIVYCEGIKLGDAEKWEEIYQRFLHTETHIEKELLIKGLGCSTNITLINKFLKFAVFNDSPELPKQYRVTIIQNILDGDYSNVNHTLTFISCNIKNIIELRGDGFLKKIFNAIKQKIIEMKNLKTLSSLIDSNINNLGSSLKSGRDAIEYSKKTIAWIKKYSPIISDAFELKLIV